jgi:hypothetical protein
MRFLRMIVRRDEGSASVVELMVASAMSLGVLAILATLFTSVFKVDSYADQDNRTLATLRTTNDKIVKELRQAGKVYIESYSCSNLNRLIRFWIDKNSDGHQEPGEQITWRVEPTTGGKARITRNTESTGPTTYSDDLVWDPTEKNFHYNVAVPTCSPVTLPHPTTVAVTLTGDVDPERYATSREIRSEVRLRNVPD